MKKLSSKVTLLASVLAVAGMFIVPVAQAAEDKAAKKAKRDADNLKKYDKNANGKLDADEEAMMKADMEKAKAEKKKKSEGK